MKKLFILLAAVTLTAMSAKVFAQGTGVAPQIGSAHDYWVNADDETSQTSGEGNTYRWWVSTIDDLKVPIDEGTEFTVESGIYDGTGGVNNFTIQLVWNPVSAGSIYYLVVEETDLEGCKNLKATAIQPVNAFDVIFAAINESDEDADNPERCAPDIALTADGTTITYDYGDDEFIYKITSTGLYSDWTFNYAFTNSLGDATPTIEYSSDGSSYATTTVSGTGISVDPDATGTATVYFKVSLDNKGTDEGAGNYEEGLSGQSMVLSLTNISDGESAPRAIYMSDGETEFTGAVEQTQTVNARPATTGIGYN